MELLSRGAWGADPESLPGQAMTLPARELWLHHTVTAVTDDPIADMKTVEAVGLRRFGIISYSWCIHPSGVVLEGAGVRRGAHTERRNSTSFGVAWIGNYDERIPKVQQIDATRRLVAWLIREGHLKPGTYPTGGHRDLAATRCPGDRLYAILDDLRVRWVEPSPAPRPPVVTDYPDEEDDMRRYDLEIALDGGGNGWGMVDVAFERVVSLIAHGPYPPADGYWYVPVLGRQDRDGKTVVTATEGPAGGKVLVSVWTLGA